MCPLVYSTVHAADILQGRRSVLPYAALSAMDFSEKQLQAFEIATRVSSSLSIIGTLFIVGTFLSCPDFRQPINCLVFYASCGNLFSSAATMISRSGITAGEISPLCQGQGFFIQMCACLMPA